jgi:signal transduction histidine kinase
MDFNFGSLGARLTYYWLIFGALLFIAAGVWGLLRRIKELRGERARERRLREELEAYARLDAAVPESGDLQALGKRVSRTVAQVSAFRRAALMAKDAEGRLFVAGSVGMDDLTVAGLNAWGERARGPRLSEKMGEERNGCSNDSTNGHGNGSLNGAGMRLGMRDPAMVKRWTRSFTLELRHEPVVKVGGGLEQGCSEVMMAPMWTTSGKMIGAVVVNGILPDKQMEESLAPVEMLAAKLARALENAALAERLLRSERLAGLGQLAGGVAHALNNPLAAVMGYAELIAETSGEPRVKEDAAMILREALRMRESVQSMVDLWQPSMTVDEDVDISGMVHRLATECKGKLAERGVRLVLEARENGTVVTGNRFRLQQVLEHLLNNAAQAVAVAPLEAGEKHAIRVTVRQDERGVQVIVSDSGPGFAEPARAFDPFYSGLRSEQGAGLGLGLSVCYGIVREHGGEISAFNLHPRGAAVVLELPTRRHEAVEHAVEQSA